MSTTLRPVDPRHDLLVRAAIAPRPQARAAYERWRGGIDLDVLDEASVRLLPHLARRIEGEADDDLADQVRKVARFTWLRSQMMVSSTLPALRALGECGVPAMLVKGAAVVHHAGMAVTVRPMDDLDIAVPPDRLLDATHALVGAGFHGELVTLTGNHPEAIVSSLHAMPFYDARGVCVDLHWHLLHERLHPGADEDFWSNAEPATLRDVPCLVSSREDTLLHVIVHGATWDRRASLQWATDAALLTSTGTVDWQRLVQSARRHRVAHLLADGLSYLRELGAGDIPDVAITELRAVRRARTGQLIKHATRLPGRPGRAARDLRRAAMRHLAPGRPFGPRFALAETLSAHRALQMPAQPEVPPVELGEIVTGLLRPDGTGCPHLVAGWEYPEPHGTWSGASRARIVLPLSRPLSGPLLLETELIGFVTPAHPRLQVVLSVDDRKIVAWPFHWNMPHAERCTAWIPPADNRRVIDLTLDIRDPCSGPVARYNGDSRLLGVGLRWLRVTRP